MRYLLLCSLFVLSPVAAFGESRVSIGYFASFVDPEIQKIPWRNLTHVCHAYLKTDDQGKLVTDKTMPNKQLTQTARERGVKVLLSLGGGRTTSGLERVTANKKSVVAYVDGVVKLVAENDYDGVDLVWEFPRDRKTRAGFSTLVATLRTRLDARAKADGRPEPYLLTAAVSPSAFFGKWIEVGSLLKSADWLNVMTYDMSGPWSRSGGHHAPLLPSPRDPERGWRSVSQAMNYWHKQRSVPKEKLVVGIPLFGRGLPVKQPFAQLDPAKRKQHGTLTFAQIRDLVGKGWPAEWDRASQAPWLRAPGGKSLILTYDDRNSVHKKATWARGLGYRGLFFWAIHGDRMPDGTHWLIRAADKAWPIEKQTPANAE